MKTKKTIRALVVLLVLALAFEGPRREDIEEAKALFKYSWELGL